MRKSFLIFSIFLSTVVRGQNSSLAGIVKEIAASNKYESAYVGFAGSPSEQYSRMKQLSKLADDKELLQLIRHTNAAVRIYSYLALQMKYPEKAKTVYKKITSDSSTVFTLIGCVGGSNTVGSIIRQFKTNTID